MPINAFGGEPGSGKTYGVLEHVILPAIAKGRFVITNIEGLEDDLIYQYVAKEFYKGKIICIGHIRQCSRDAPDSENFFPGAESLDAAMEVPSPDRPNVNGGDLVVIDEATRHWSSSDKVKKQHSYFFREHRHFANVLGHTCDMVVIDPDLAMLARALKGKIELASVTHKPKEIGMNAYVVKLFRGVRTTGKPISVQGPYRFDKKVYSLYKSYAHADAKEQAIDRRQVVFKNPRFLLFAFGLLIMLVFCIWIFSVVYQRQVNKNTKISPERKVAEQDISNLNKPRTLPIENIEELSSLRVAGEVSLQGERWILLVDQNGSTRLENPAAFVGKGSLIVGNLGGKRVATWTGPQNKNYSIVESVK